VLPRRDSRGLPLHQAEALRGTPGFGVKFVHSLVGSRKPAPAHSPQLRRPKLSVVGVATRLAVTSITERWVVGFLEARCLLRELQGGRWRLSWMRAPVAGGVAELSSSPGAGHRHEGGSRAGAVAIQDARLSFASTIK